MIVTIHLCMPEGEPMRRQWTQLCELLREDNRMVIAAMLREGIPVADTVEDLGLEYVPEWRRTDDNGEPILELYGLRAMLARGTFSCGDACGYESAVQTEKYGVPTEPLGVDVGEGDMTGDYHGIYVTPSGAVDPVARYLGLRGGPVLAANPSTVRRTSCRIEDGRVLCDLEGTEMCCLDERGIWNCPSIPGLHGRREKIDRVRRTRHGAWARTVHGAAVPVCTTPISVRRRAR